MSPTMAASDGRHGPAARSAPGVGLGMAMLLVAATIAGGAQAQVDIAQSPLSVTPYVPPNILLILDNSNTMVEDVTGAVAAECDPGPLANCAAGAASPLSKSEIIRGVGRRLLDEYLGQVNLGLMAYQQNPASSSGSWDGNVILADIVDRIYDVSYDPSNYDPDFSGNPWDSTRKRFSIPNPSQPQNGIYFNIRIPGYTTGRGELNYYTTRESGNNWRNEPFSFNCYRTKTGTSDSLTSGYGGSCGTTSGNLNDSARARGVTNWGQRMIALPFNRREWVSTTSPGLGYLHTPIAMLDETHKSAIAKKLAPQHHNYSRNLLTNPDEPLIAAGLTPLEGTLYTARDYFLNRQTHFGNSQGRANARYPLPDSCDVNTAIWLTDGMPSVSRTGRALGSDVAKALEDAVKAATELHEEAGVDLYVVGFAMPPTVSEDQLDQLARAGGTARGYMAEDEGSLDEAMTRIFDNIIASPRESATSSVVNGDRLQAGSRLFSAGFRSEDWSGRLEGYRLGENGNLEPFWDAEAILRSQGSRNLMTRDGPLSAQNSELTAEQIAWLHGTDGTLRSRGDMGERRLLGDIVNATPVLMSEGGREVLFVAANDGMLHAFEVHADGGGRELFAYLPAELVNGEAPPIARLMEVDYAHRYFMDGTPTLRNIGSTSDPRWVLVGAMGAGGRTVFALDVTEPGAPRVLWEFTDPELGEGVHSPVVARLSDDRWAAIFGNGYNAESRNAALFVVDLLGGERIRRIETPASGTGLANGLAPPAVTQWPHYDGNARYAYAGDLLGSMWRFDLAGGQATSLLQGEASRPITAAPALAAQSGETGTLTVLFGTGSYFRRDDAASIDPQRLYGLHTRVDDTGPISSHLLREQVIAGEASYRAGSDIEYRLRATTDRALPSGSRGWYLGLPAGERVVSTPVVARATGGYRVGFSTLVPPLEDPCAGGREGFLMDLRVDNGGSGTRPRFDLSRDGAVDDLSRIAGEAVSGIGFGGGESVSVVHDPSSGFDLIFDGDPGIDSGFGLERGVRSGRQSWRQLR